MPLLSSGMVHSASLRLILFVLSWCFILKTYCSLPCDSGGEQCLLSLDRCNFYVPTNRISSTNCVYFKDYLKLLFHSYPIS
jgi:hypothetical protein